MTIPLPENVASERDQTRLQTSPLEMSSDSILEDFKHHFSRTLGQHEFDPSSPFAYQALVYVVRDRLMERNNQTRIAQETNDCRRVSYLSLEYLMGRLLRNALLSLDLEEAAATALECLGLELEDLYESERDTGLGNGGLGRLAACFLDSCATLRLPVVGYGIRYHFGMFHQQIENGYQVEGPDCWLRDGFPWEIERPEHTQIIQFGGRSEAYGDHYGQTRYRWVDSNDVLAVPYDIPIPGFGTEMVNTLRLWSAAATEAFDLQEFNAGSYSEAVAAKNEAENITMVLYPNAANEGGHELRLKQQYFLASASLQDTLCQWTERHGGSFENFASKHCFQINDTHPAIAVAELMRLLIDEHQIEWDEAWEITTHSMAYTNHTLLPEALELWPVSLFRRLLPRLLDILFEINARFISEVSRHWPDEIDRIRRMSLIQEDHEPMIRMAYLAIIGSFSVNGVAALHSRLLREGLFVDFAELWPHKFNNKTNGVTHRRWLRACNPGLSRLITATIGPKWVEDLEQLRALESRADDPSLLNQWREIKLANKDRLITAIEDKTGVRLERSMLFDVQVKRIHEYKRQLLNVLHAIHLYDRIRRGETDQLTPRAIIIGGKAAPGYAMAKSIIKCINNVAQVINSDPVTEGQLRMVFFPDYNVSAMEMICPAADLSEQISTAGKEASGTGNMKLMMNGAITIGTLDGANIEILEAVGDENFFKFGLSIDEVEALKTHYDPASIIAVDKDFGQVMRLLEGGHFNRFEAEVFKPIRHALLNPHDPWMTAADFRSFADAQQRVEQAYREPQRWSRMSLLNTASSGRFSTDRTMRDYNEEIWKLSPLDFKSC